MNRKTFLSLAGFSALGTSFFEQKSELPIIISTWESGLPVNAAAWPLLIGGKPPLDAIEAGGRSIEDKIDCCVGLGGNPDRDGVVTLDASVMTGEGLIGSVAALERIKHPITVARQVMEKTPHVLLAGRGAQQFALEMGHPLESGELSPQAETQYKEWLVEKKYQPKANVERLEMPKRTNTGEFNHDTMAILALSANGKMAGGVTTSGMGFKMSGRVGDSPIIGAGLYVDGEVGAATSSGLGEEVIRVCGSHLVVELMRQGYKPEKACKMAIERIIKTIGPRAKEIQVGFIALNKAGQFGAFSLVPGFIYAVKTEKTEKLFESKSWYA